MVTAEKPLFSPASPYFKIPSRILGKLPFLFLSGIECEKHVLHSTHLVEEENMTKGRLEAFSDGVLAIIITIMVLELKVPHGDDWDALAKLWPVFVSYVLSFIYVGIYWNNHHHLIAASRRIDGSIMWANLHLLFWLSLTPFVTGWMGENHFAALPTGLYGFVLLMAAIAYWILQARILAGEPASSALRTEIGFDFKGKISPVLYIAGIATSFVIPWLAWALFAFVAIMWLVPDRRIERALGQGKAE